MEMPILGLGLSYQRSAPAPGTAERATIAALHNGYRLLDTAKRYGNEHEVGRGLHACRDTVSREEVFVTSKLWPSDYGMSSARASYKSQCASLGVEKMDLFLLHWPAGSYGSSNREVRAETWRALEMLLDEGVAYRCMSIRDVVGGGIGDRKGSERGTGGR